MDTFINLPYGEPGSGFYVSELINHVQSSGRDYIIQGQQHRALHEHTKPQSLDVWLREGFTTRHDTAQGVNEVVDALPATGRFELAYGLICPDTGVPCKGLRLVGCE